MSNSTIETDNDLVFGEAEASRKPTLICVGTVGNVGQAKITASQNYILIPINLDPVDAGRKGKINFLYRPEWLVRGFKTHELKQADEKAHFVYSKFIASREKLSVLRGLCGSKEAFARLTKAILSLPDSGGNGPSMEDVADTLRTFFESNVDADGQPVLVGYELVQARTKTDDYETDTKGKKRRIYLLDNRYEVGDFWDVTSEGIKKQNRRAEGSKGMVKMTYSGVPF